MSITRSTTVLRGALLAALLTAAARPSAAINLVGYEPRLHDRYYVGPDKEFVGDAAPWALPGADPLDPLYTSPWSGHGRYLDPTAFNLPNGTLFQGTFCWSTTMITEHYFLMAYHVHQTPFQDPDLPYGSPLRFYRGNDPSVNPIDDPDKVWEGRLVLHPGANQYPGVRVGTTDLWLGHFEDGTTPDGQGGFFPEVLPSDWVQRYPLVKRDRTTNWPAYIDPEVFLSGMGDLPPAGQHDETTYVSVRAGRNQIVDRLSGNITFDTVSPPGLGADEAVFEDKDSSSPTFAKTPAGPSLFGINSVSIGGPTMPEYWSQIKALLPPTETLNIATDLLGDLDADYDVTPVDSAILEQHFGQSPVSWQAYFRGDLNRDGIVNQADRDVMAAQMGKKLRSPADFDQNFLINGADFAQIASHWESNVTAHLDGDVTGDGHVNLADVLQFELNRTTILTGPAAVQIPGDANVDGAVTNADMLLWASHYGQQGLTPFASGDVTGDGTVDRDDVEVILGHLNTVMADVDGNLRVTVSDILELTDPDNWMHATSLGRAGGDVNLDGVVNEADLAAVGSFLGYSHRPQALPNFAGVIPGDYNGDFVIDGADLLVWETHLGSAYAAADGSKNGVVDSPDLVVWLDNFDGNDPPPFAVIPEPASVTTSALAVALFALRRRSMRSAG